MDINKKECPGGLEILEYGGKGYDRTMHFGEWRVAFLNWAEKFDKGSDFPAERHLLTDEVFVLLAGSATLYIGAELAPVRLEPEKLYNVWAGVWHKVAVSRDAKLLIVENHSTGPENSEYMK